MAFLSGVYAIINILNGKPYFGSSNKIEVRWSRHKRDLILRRHPNAHLQAAWDKYGESSFVFVLVEEVIGKELLLSREQFYLDSQLSYLPERGYNFLRTAGSSLGTKHSEVHCKRISEAKKASSYSHSEETRRKIGSTSRGRCPSAETRKKMSLARAGKPNGCAGLKAKEETRKKMSSAQEQRWQNLRPDEQQARLAHLFSGRDAKFVREGSM
jgi:group I intron endonuclease